MVDSVEFRDVGVGRPIQQLSLDSADLTVESAHFNGEFDVEYALLEGGDQNGVVGEGVVRYSIVRDVHFSEAQLGPLTLANVLWDSVDLSNASVQQATIRQTEWRNCRAVGLRLSVDHATDLYVVDCGFNFATIHIERVKGTIAFRGCSFREATITGNLSDTVFLDCDFLATEFDVTGAKGCDLQGSRLTGSTGLSTLQGARMSTEQAVSVARELATELGFVVHD